MAEMKARYKLVEHNWYKSAMNAVKALQKNQRLCPSVPDDTCIELDNFTKQNKEKNPSEATPWKIRINVAGKGVHWLENQWQIDKIEFNMSPNGPLDVTSGLGNVITVTVVVLRE